MKITLIILGVLALVASVVMFQVGASSSHLSELQDYFWIPIPLGMLLLGGAAGQKKS